MLEVAAATAGKQEGRRPDKAQRTQQKKKNYWHRVENGRKTYQKQTKHEKRLPFFWKIFNF